MTNEEVVSVLHSECFISEIDEALPAKFALGKFSGEPYFDSYRSSNFCIHILIVMLYCKGSQLEFYRSSESRTSARKLHMIGLYTIGVITIHNPCFRCSLYFMII
jgi:hypothetical protein